VTGMLKAQGLSRALLLAGLAGLVFAGAAAAAQKVTFASGTQLVVSRVEAKENVLVLHLLEGGQIAVPKAVVAKVESMSNAEAMEEWKRALHRSGTTASAEGEEGKEGTPAYQPPLGAEERDEVTPGGLAAGGGGMVPTTRDAFMNQRPQLVTDPNASRGPGQDQAKADVMRRLARGEKLPGSTAYGRDYWSGDPSRGGTKKGPAAKKAK